jgi:5'-nucleotidase
LSEQLVKIVLLHTSDIHSVFRTMPRIAGLAAELRKKHGSASFLAVDCGDHLDRMSLITEGSGGAAHTQVLEATGYDVITIGNNEGLTMPKARLEELYGSRRTFRVVCANLREAESGERPNWILPGIILERKGLRLGFIGATARYPIFYRLLGWEVDDPFEAVRREAEALRGQVDAVILLSHLGLTADKRIAEEIPGIDVILGGHTHHILEHPLRHGSAYLCGCGMAGAYAGEVELYFNRDDGSFLRAEGQLHRTEEAPEEPQVKELLERIQIQSEETMQQPVASLSEVLPTDWERDSPFGNLLAAGLRKWTGAEIGLINSGQILQSLLPGKVTKGMLLELCPSPVNPCLIRIRGSALRQALEQSLQEEYVAMPIYGYGFRGKMLGGLCVDGLEILWRPEGEPGSRIAAILAAGRPLEPDREYLVGTADMFTFGIGYLSLKECREPDYFLPEFLRDVLERELNTPGAMTESRKPRYKRCSLL